MTEERRCDLCQFEKDAPCPTRECNSVNGLKEFKPKGAPAEGSPGWKIVAFTYRDTGELIIQMETKAGDSKIVSLTPDEIAAFAN